jgi:hypothetical protein
VACCLAALLLRVSAAPATPFAAGLLAVQDIYMPAVVGLTLVTVIAACRFLVLVSHSGGLGPLPAVCCLSLSLIFTAWLAGWVARLCASYAAKFCNIVTATHRVSVLTGAATGAAALAWR